MSNHPFKLGDKVVIENGPNKGREGHIVGITNDGPRPDVIVVRLYVEPIQTATVSPEQLRAAQ